MRSGAFVARTTYIDEHGVAAETTRSERVGSGRWHDALAVLAVSNRVRPPGVAVRHSALEAVGGFRTDLPHAADWEMWARLAALGPVWFEDRSLARYRRHSASDTAGRVLSGENITERLRCIDIVSESVDADRRASLARRARGYSALFAAAYGGRPRAQRPRRRRRAPTGRRGPQPGGGRDDPLTGSGTAGPHQSTGRSGAPT